MPKFRPKQPAGIKRDTWIVVQTRLRPPVHARLFALAQRRGATMELVARELIEACLPGWEKELNDADLPTTVGAR